MYYNKSYGIDPYMYNDPYTFLIKAQEGITVTADSEPISSNYPSYANFKIAYDDWMMRNSPIGLATSIIQQPDSLMTQTPEVVSIPSKTPMMVNKYQGPSVWDFLTAQGVQGDLQTRKKIAKVLGMKNYRGTPAQNKLMINLIEQNPQVIASAAQQGMLTSQKSSVSGANRAKPAQTIIPTNNDEDGNKTVIDSSGVRTTVDSTGKIINIDSTGTKSDSSKIKLIDTTGKKIIDTTGTLPKPTGSKGDPDENLAQALLAAAGVLTVGAGLATEAVTTGLDLRDIAKKFSVNPTLLESSFKKIKPKLVGAVRAYENMGLGAQEIYNELERLLAEDEEIAKAAFKKDVKKAAKMEPLKTYTSKEAKQFAEAKKTLSPKELVEIRNAEIQSGMSKVKPGVAPSLPKPVTSPWYQKASSKITESNAFKNAKKYAEEVAKTSRKLPNNAYQFMKKLRFQEGGQQENSALSENNMQEIFGFVAMQLQNNASPMEITQKLMTNGISKDDAINIIEQVSTLLASKVSKKSGMGQTSELEEDVQNEEIMQYGGYSGTYDQSSGSYFKYGGNFVPTYDNILPEYMYGYMMQDGGSLNIGDTLDVTPEEMEYLRQQGYDFDTM